MKLQINGEEREFTNAAVPFTLATLIETLGMKPDRVAVELNRDIVSRARWGETALNEGDKLEVVQFVGGGLEQRSLDISRAESHAFGAPERAALPSLP
jgi:thiamine biosynthesis protein ThiS